MPSPNRWGEELVAEDDPPPVCLAWLSGSTYSFSAGDPGLMWTPGSSAAATEIGPTKLIASTAAAHRIPPPMVCMKLTIAGRWGVA
jgi:hypothetical protein